MSDDYIEIQGLEIDASIGVHGFEQLLRQKVRVCVRLAVDVQQAARSDQLEDAVNYVRVVEQIQAVVQTGHIRLLETLAERIAQGLLQEFALNWIRVEVSKPHILGRGVDVRVVIERRRAHEH